MTWRNRPPPEPRGEGPLRSEPPRRVTEPSRLPPRHARPPSRVPPRDCHQADPRGSRLLPRARRSRRSHGAFARLCPAGNGFPAAPPGVLTQTPPRRSLPLLGRRTRAAHVPHTRRTRVCEARAVPSLPPPLRLRLPPRPSPPPGGTSCFSPLSPSVPHGSGRPEDRSPQPAARAKRSPPPVPVNKVLSEHSHTRPFTPPAATFPLRRPRGAEVTVTVWPQGLRGPTPATPTEPRTRARAP